MARPKVGNRAVKSYYVEKDIIAAVYLLSEKEDKSEGEIVNQLLAENEKIRAAIKKLRRSK